MIKWLFNLKIIEKLFFHKSDFYHYNYFENYTIVQIVYIAQIKQIVT